MEDRLEAQKVEERYRLATGDIDGEVLEYDSTTGLLHIGNENGHGKTDVIYNDGDGEVQYLSSGRANRFMDKLMGRVDNGSSSRGR
jgi:ribosomal protein L27